MAAPDSLTLVSEDINSAMKSLSDPQKSLCIPAFDLVIAVFNKYGEQKHLLQRLSKRLVIQRKECVAMWWL
jgi:hypothetical protein